MLFFIYLVAYKICIKVGIPEDSKYDDIPNIPDTFPPKFPEVLATINGKEVILKFPTYKVSA